MQRRARTPRSPNHSGSSSGAVASTARSTGEKAWFVHCTSYRVAIPPAPHLTRSSTRPRGRTRGRARVSRGSNPSQVGNHLLGCRTHTVHGSSRRLIPQILGVTSMDWGSLLSWISSPTSPLDLWIYSGSPRSYVMERSGRRSDYITSTVSAQHLMASSICFPSLLG